MRKVYYIVICGLICSFLVSCKFINKYDPGFVQRSVNIANSKLLKKGMTKQEVIDIMGAPQIQREFHVADIWYYYTVWDWADAAVSENECSPLVFENNQLIGWGLAYYRNYIHKDWLFDTEAMFREKNLGKR